MMVRLAAIGCCPDGTNDVPASPEMMQPPAAAIAALRAASFRHCVRRTHIIFAAKQQNIICPQDNIIFAQQIHHFN